MLHENYQKLTIPERVQTVGMVVHALQNDVTFYNNVLELLEQSKDRGVFEGVVFVPQSNKED